MELLGATVAPVDAGRAHAQGGRLAPPSATGWPTSRDTHYVIGSCVGPAPFPALVRDLQRVIGDEARAQILETAGRLPDRVVACVGGGSNAIGIFVPFVDDAGVELIGVEAAGEGIETGRHGAPLTVGGRGGVLHGAYSAIMQDEDGQILEAHSISAGLDYPGTGPEHAWLRDSGRARYVGGHRRRGAGGLPARSPGWRASSRRSSPPTRSPGCWPRASRHAERRPRLPLRPRRQGPRRGAGEAGPECDTGAERIAAAFAAARGRAALMPYLMGGFPDVETSVAVGIAYAEAGADLVELGVPFSDPLADGPVIHAAATAALAAGATVHAVARGRRADRRARPGRADVLREPAARPRARALRRRARASAASAG